VRRTILAAVSVVVAGIAVVLIAGSGHSSDYRVAAIFDTANGMVSGQQVKIAGAVVGSVDSVQLAAGPKARIVMSVDRRFAPFRADASCSILPEGLISENFVACDPGHAATALPAPGKHGMPTVPLAHTTVPFSLQDVLNVLSLPTDQRLQVLISELGIGLAARGQDLNGLLRRANPALQQSRRVLDIVDAQRAQLGSAVSQTDQVLASLAARRGAVTQFVDRAAAVARTTAAHRAALAASVQRLPAMLTAVRPGLHSLTRAATNATPLLGELRAAAPGLTQLTTTLPAFARAGIPAVSSLASAARAGLPAVRDAVPIADRLQTIAGPLATLGTQLAQLLVHLRGNGGIEGLLRLTYTFATNTALYDNVSHIVTFIVSLAPNCIFGQQGGFDVKGCSHSYDSPGQGQLPINEPSCGARSGAWFDQRCPPAVPGPITLARRSKAAPASAQKLLNGAFSKHPPATGQLQALLAYLTQ
jgi:phospholipid/cholesterol/gamma-HCH transport system substrate-binding protein